MKVSTLLLMVTSRRTTWYPARGPEGLGMKRFALGLFLCCIGLAGSAQTSDDALVRQFFPAAHAQARYSDATRQVYTFERADLDGSGSANYLVCVYFNGFNDVLRVLRVTGASASVAAD